MCNCRLLARTTLARTTPAQTTPAQTTVSTSFIEDGRMYGTWDFKWPQGSQIDVQFQALPADQLSGLQGMGAVPPGFHLSAEEAALIAQGKDEFGKLTRVVECLAQRWLKGSGNDARVTLVFSHDHPVPLDISNGDPVQDYDVLVSLATLPLGRGTAQTQEDVENVVFLPGSELGRYCQRVDYGVPTTYLGTRPFYDGTPSEYFHSNEFWHWCVHEFGHVLGLPHEHQNPKVQAKIAAGMKTPPEVQKILALALGDTRNETPNPRITLAEVEEEITTAWPVPRGADGAFLYSDLRDYPEGKVPDDSDSVMFHIYWQRLLLKAEGNEPPRFLESPTPGDLAQVRAMYP